LLNLKNIFVSLHISPTCKNIFSHLFLDISSLNTEYVNYLSVMYTEILLPMKTTRILTGLAILFKRAGENRIRYLQLVCIVHSVLVAQSISAKHQQYARMAKRKSAWSSCACELDLHARGNACSGTWLSTRNNLIFRVYEAAVEAPRECVAPML